MPRVANCGVCAVPAGPLGHVQVRGRLNEETHLCEQCVVRTAFRCANCGTWKDNDHLGTTRYGHPWCEYCAFILYVDCAVCRAHVRRDVSVDRHGRRLCQPCNAAASFHCMVCLHEVDVIDCARQLPEGRLCYGCYDNWRMEHEPPPIANYSWKPTPIFRGKPANHLFFGFELEVERTERAEPRKLTNEQVATGVREALLDDDKKPIVYVKKDGSLTNGFEIVSHPFSWDWLKANGKRFDCLFDLVKAGFVSHDTGTCGMHVHMSRNAFTKLHLYKFIKFFQNEQDLIVRVSQRGTSDSALEAWTRIMYSEQERRDATLVEIVQAGRCDVKYQAVNLMPPETVEIRIFRGTLKKERFFKNLEFCQAVYEFSGIVPMNMLNLRTFIGYVWVHRHEFPNLHEFLKERYDFTAGKALKRKRGAPKHVISAVKPKYFSEPDKLDEVWVSPPPKDFSVHHKERLGKCA